MCDEDYFEDFSVFDERVEAFKDILRESVKQEMKERISSLESQLKELVEVKDRLDAIKGEYKKKEDALETERRDMQRKMKFMRLTELLSDFSTEAWLVRDIGRERPKCDRCDERRVVHFKSPAGRDLTEACSCSAKLPHYAVVKLECKEFRLDYNNHKLCGWFREPRDDEESWSHGEYSRDRFYNGRPFEQIEIPKYWDGTFFFDEGTAQSFADYLNGKVGVDTVG